MLDEGRTYVEVEQALGCSSPYITRWKRRFLESRIRGLASRYVGGQPRVRTAALEAKILEKTRTQPKDGSTHWSTRKLGVELGVSHMMVARVWARAGLQPHRLERHMASDDPDFERKAADIIGLYLNPPRHAAIFCLDEKSHIQALDRLDPVLPLSPGRADDVDLLIAPRLRVDYFAQEPNELLAGVPSNRLAQNLTATRVQGGKERQRPVPVVLETTSAPSPFAGPTAIPHAESPTIRLLRPTRTPRPGRP
jgi:transposase